MNTEKLRSNLQIVREDIIKQQAAVATDPQDIGAKLTLSSLQAHYDDLKNQLRTESVRHHMEIIELHLKGPKLEEGRLPLGLMASLSEHFARAIQTASTRIHTGRDYRRTPKEVNRLLNLSFAAIQPGSTRLFISADANPNLFGDSLSETTLKATFSILAKSTFEELLDEMDSVGIRSLKNLHGLFSDILRDELELDLKWTDIDANEHVWIGTKELLNIWKKRIENIRSQDKGEISLSGLVSLISLNGRFEILLDDGRKIKSVFPMRLLDTVRGVTINDYVNCVFSQRMLIDISHGRQALAFTLKDLKKSNA